MMTSLATRFVQSTNGMNDRMRVAAEMLIAGVAFQRDGKIWDVFSHEGDMLGTMSTFMVSQAANMLRKSGLINDGLRDYGGHPSKNDPKHDQRFLGCVTFGRCVSADPATWTEIQEMMNRRFRNPVDLV